MRVKKQLAIILFLLLLSAVSALEELPQFNFKITSITDQIPPGGESEFKIEIKSNIEKQEVLQLSANELDIFPFSEFARAIIVDPSIVSINNREVKTVNVKIRSLDTALANKNHITKINVKSLTSDYKAVIQLDTFVISEKDLVQIVPKVPETVIPGEVNTFQVFFKNRGNVEFEDLELYLTSEVWNGNKILSFKANENKTEFFSLSVPPGTKAGEYILSIRLYKAKDLKGEAKASFNVGHHPDIKEKEEVVEGFLMQEVRIINKNDGNAPVKTKLDFEINWFKRIFTQTTPKAEFENGRYIWELTVNPASEVIIKVTTDYRPALIGLIVFGAFLGLIIYFLSRGVRIKKRVFKIKHPTHSSEVKIMLHVKNRDSKEAHNVKVVDLLPSALKPTHEYSTLKPEKIQQGTRGIRLIWTIETLSPGEERIISYNARKETNLLGPIYLPPASVQYINRKAKFVIYRSNSFDIKF